MIGGYIHREPDPELESRLAGRLGTAFKRIDLGEQGFLFHDEPYGDAPTSSLVSADLVAVSQDLLVASDGNGEYRALDLASDFAPLFSRDPAAAFDSLVSDARMAVADRRSGRATLYLASHRAGSGRIYYHVTDAGIVFSSDLRFLLGLVRCEVNRLAVYAILKLGAIPEPLTISENVSAVPPGHYLAFDAAGGEQRSVPYFRLVFGCEREPEPGRSPDEILRPIKSTLLRSARFLAGMDPAILLSGGIDSSLYGCYLGEAAGRGLRGFYCAFGEEDPELPFARQIAERVGAELRIGEMGRQDALRVLDDATRLTDHPFSDFSSLPITFLLQRVREAAGERSMLVECNGGDDCFGFPDLGSEAKFRLKHRFPGFFKSGVAALLKDRGYWKWESLEGTLARFSALADAHETTPLDYALVLAPVRYLGLQAPSGWDQRLREVMDGVFSAWAGDYHRLSYCAKTTVRQLLHVNSRRWAAKALSVGESIGLHVVYPYIWRDVLVEQGRIPWELKIKDGVVKWPLKRLLEEQMPESFIHRAKSGFVPPFAGWLTNGEFNRRAREVLLDRDAAVTQVLPSRMLEELLADALQGRKLRHSILNLLWGALFTEMWLRRHATG